MAKLQTSVLIESLQQQTIQILEIAKGEWLSLAPEIFSATPAVGGWSAKQCLAHLNAYSAYYLPALQNAMNNGIWSEVQPLADFTPGWLGNKFTQMMQTNAAGMPTKKMKAFKAYMVDNAIDGTAVIETFIKSQETMLELLQQAAKLNLQKIKIPISIARYIKLQLGDVLMFYVAHNMRHVLQAQRAIAAK